MDEKTINRILASYGIDYLSVAKVQKGYRNESLAIRLKNGRIINLILYKSEPGILKKIHSANRVGNFLASRGLPVRKTIDQRVIKLQNGNFVKYGALYTWLPGETIAWEAYTMEHLKVLGATLSTLHKTLLSLDPTGLSSVAAEYLATHERMSRYFSTLGVHQALRKKLGLTLDPKKLRRFGKILKLCSQLPAQQVLHMDFVRGNVLFTKKTLDGIIDLEKTGLGHPTFDVARTLAFLLVDCKYKDEAKVRKYFLHSGYNKRGPQKLTKIRLNGSGDLLEELINFFLLHDLYKFLRHNPYESLPENEHFVRTRDILRRRDVIKVLK